MDGGATVTDWKSEKSSSMDRTFAGGAFGGGVGGLYSTSLYSLLITFSSIIIPAAAVSKSKSIGLLDLVLERVIASDLGGVKICVSLKVPL